MNTNNEEFIKDRMTVEADKAFQEYMSQVTIINIGGIECVEKEELEDMIRRIISAGLFIKLEKIRVLSNPGIGADTCIPYLNFITSLLEGNEG